METCDARVREMQIACPQRARLPRMRPLRRLALGFTLLILAATTAAAAPAPSHPGRAALPFIADDYARALAAARARQIPLFIEAWAPW